MTMDGAEVNELDGLFLTRIAIDPLVKRVERRHGLGDSPSSERSRDRDLEIV